MNRTHVRRTKHVKFEYKVRVLQRFLQVHEDHSDDYTYHRSCKSFFWKMSDGFVEIVVRWVFFASIELVQRLRVKTCFESDVDSIVDDNHREYYSDGEDI